MPRRAAALLMAVPLLAAFAPAPKRRDDDAKALQGTWKVVRVESQGEARPKELRIWDKVVLTRGRLEMRRGKEVDAFSFVLDAKKKPKEIALTVDWGPAVSSTGDPALPGIYKLEKDTLTVCFSNVPPQGRPKEFATRPGSHHHLFVFQRVKP